MKRHGHMECPEPSRGASGDKPRTRCPVLEPGLAPRAAWHPAGRDPQGAACAVVRFQGVGSETASRSGL